MRKKPWTPRQLKRFPEFGYWLTVGPLYKTHSIYDIEYFSDAGVQSNRMITGKSGWHTVMWNCCTGKKEIEASKKPGSEYTFVYFKTYEEYQASEFFLSIPYERCPLDLEV